MGRAERPGKEGRRELGKKNNVFSAASVRRFKRTRSAKAGDKREGQKNPERSSKLAESLEEEEREP